MHLRPRRGWEIVALPEEYSRVTNPERFQPLHDFAVDLLGRLYSSYQVIERDAFDLIPGRMRAFEEARPSVTLTPTTEDAAPIAVGFTRFPSLLVRCGRWFSTSFPSCGCDACAATAEEEIRRFEELVGDVVAGHFCEELQIRLFRAPRLWWWRGSGMPGHRHHGAGMSTLQRDVARAMGAHGSGRVQWRPWVPRATRVD
jgi:hypothetical protein